MPVSPDKEQALVDLLVKTEKETKDVPCWRRGKSL